MMTDPWIITFSAATVIATIWLGFWSAKRSRTAHDFFVAGRSVSVGWNASAISGEYLSAASFMGVAGMVMSSGYDALWYPVCYACGYLFLLLFIAGPLRRFGAYTIPDFAEGRFDSPVFRKIAVVFVLFIGFFYTMPQMKGAGTTLAYIFPGLPYSVGVVLVGAIITLNVALGGMKGITLVQAFQFWLKLFAISVPVFVLMAVYGHYGHQVGANGNIQHPTPNIQRSTDQGDAELKAQGSHSRAPLLDKAPADSAWLNPFGPLTTKAAKAATAAKGKTEELITDIPLKAGTSTNADRFVKFHRSPVSQGLEMYCELVGRTVVPHRNDVLDRLDRRLGGRLTRMRLLDAPGFFPGEITYQNTNAITAAQLKKVLETGFATNGITLIAVGDRYVQAIPTLSLEKIREVAKADRTTAGAKNERRYALLYTYSLIMALVCGTAGLPHILVRFYTNPNGVAAKRTTMWVMILIGVFYLFPPAFGVLGRNQLPELYAGAGAKGTDKVVLELPRILNEEGRKGEREKGGEGSSAPLPPGSLSAVPAIGGSKIPWGSILSGITCAGAFAAFMSTFSGLLVSMTGALAHDVYGRMLRPNSTPQQRMRAFRVCAVIIGAIAMLLGMQVEPFQINFMVGQAFAIAAASYFPLLFVSCWWRGLTMKGAATGMLTGGLCALIGITLTSFSDLGWLKLADFWAPHPLLRILCEQPAIWSVPLAIGLMIVVSKLTATEVPADVRMKMLVLHAPEKLGLKQEYIQEHQGH
jgi:cation/acetate symporter